MTEIALYTPTVSVYLVVTLFIALTLGMMRLLWPRVTLSDEVILNDFERDALETVNAVIKRLNLVYHNQNKMRAILKTRASKKQVKVIADAMRL